MNKYINHKGNIIPQYWRHKWLQGNTKGIFFIVGESMSGKTTFLKSLEEEHNKMCKNRNKQIKWFSAQEIIDTIIKNVRCEKESCFENDVVIIENLECLCGKVCTGQMFIELIEKSCKDKLVICTSTVKISEIMKNQKVIYFKEIKVNRHLINMISKRLGIKLNSTQIKELLNERMSVLKGKIINLSIESKYK